MRPRQADSLKPFYTTIYATQALSLHQQYRGNRLL